MMIVRELLYVVLVPFVVSASAALVCRRWRNPPQIVWAGGVGLGYIAGQLCLAGRARAVRAFWSFARPHEAVDWLPHAILLALCVKIFATHAPRAWRRWVIVLAVLLTIGVPLRLVAGSAYVTQQWSVLEKLSHLALLAATFGLTWLLLASCRDEEQPRLRPGLLIIVAAGSAVAIALSASLVYGELCVVVAAAIAGAWLGATGFVSAGRRSLAEPVAHSRGRAGAAGVITFSLGSLIVLGHFYAQLTPTNAALLFVSMICAGGRLPNFVSTWRPWQQVATRSGLCLVPLAIAVANALLAAQSGTPAESHAI